MIPLASGVALVDQHELLALHVMLVRHVGVAGVQNVLPAVADPGVGRDDALVTHDLAEQIRVRSDHVLAPVAHREVRPGRAVTEAAPCEVRAPRASRRQAS